MKWIKYNLAAKVANGTEESTVILSSVKMSWNEANEEVAKREAHNGEYTIEDDGVEEVTEPTQLDRVEAQVTYTAMMTDTLLEV